MLFYSNQEHQPKRMTQTKYTFLLPAFKAQFFEEALRSIQNQTFSDFKVLVSDDCSPEPLKEIFDKFSEDIRFEYRRNETNIGGKNLVEHWNKLVNICNTDYLIMASDDDVYDPRFLEEIDKLSVKYPKISLLRTRVKRINTKGETIEEGNSYDEYADTLQFIKDLYKPGRIKCVANYVYKTKDLKKRKGFVDFPLAWYSDFYTAILMSEKGVATTAEILFGFRVSPISISYSKKNKKSYSLKMDATLKYADEMYNKISELKQIYIEKPEKNDIDLIMQRHKYDIYIMSLMLNPYLSFCKSLKAFFYLCIKGYVRGVRSGGYYWKIYFYGGKNNNK